MNESSAKSLTKAQKIFTEAPEEYQKLIREILKDERDVVHLKTRPNIQKKVYEHVKRIIK